MRGEQKENLTRASALVLVEQANMIAREGGILTDSRLPAARRIVEEIERQKSLAAENAGSGMGQLGRALKRFCKPCDYFWSGRCDKGFGTKALEGQICTEAVVRYRPGTMTPSRFQPREL